MLKLWMRPSSVLQEMNSRMSGWWTSITAMFAPSRLPPWVTRVETDDRWLRTATGPQALPCVVEMPAPFGRMGERAKPVPPPYFWTIAASLAVVMIPSMLSSRPITKHAESVPAPVPAFISVGELGTNSSVDMIEKKSSSARARSYSVP